MNRAWVAIAVALIACKDKARPYELRGLQTGSISDASAIVDGVEITKTTSLGAFLLPSNIDPKAIKSVAFRYGTPCGPYDVPNKLAPIEKHMTIGRYVEAKPASDSGYLWNHLVIVDAGGQDKVDVMIGKQALGRQFDGDPGSSSDGWNKVRVGHAFGTECAAEHVVTVNGAPVGKLPGNAPADLAADESDKFSLPIFVTTKAVCYRLMKKAVEYTNRKSGYSTTGDTADQTLRGPGAFYLATRPDVFGKEPDNANAPAGLFEVPCDGAEAAPAADPAAPPAAPAPPAGAPAPPAP
jgi:hypothetical protein